MARRRVEEGAAEPKPSAAERTIDMFADKPKTESPPLGTLTPEGREKAIKQEQDDAIARAKARRELEERAKSDETGSITQKELDDEREAIQAEGADTSGLGSAFFGGSAGAGATPKKEEASEPTIGGKPSKEFWDDLSKKDEGDEVSYTKGEEMYGKPGQFSTYRVGPFTSSTRVRAGETRVEALRRLSLEMETFMTEERERAKKAFLAHYPNAFSS